MQDRDIVAAIASDWPDGLVAAYDRYAPALYAYCWLLTADPVDAADATQDTFIIAVAEVDRLSDPDRLLPWLFAVARNECLGRLRAYSSAAHSAGEYPEPAAGDADGGDGPGPPGLRAVILSALEALSPDDREIVELTLRYGLDGDDLADTLGIAPNHARALASQAHARFQAAVGAQPVLGAGRRACPGLNAILSGWEGEQPFLVRTALARHMKRCDTCREQAHPAKLFAMLPPPDPPAGLRAITLRLALDASDRAAHYRRQVLDRAGPFGPTGFPASMDPPSPVVAVRNRLLAAGAAAAFAVVVGVGTVMGLNLLHHPIGSAVDAVISGHSSTPSATSHAPGTVSKRHAPGSAGPQGFTSPSGGPSPSGSAAPSHGPGGSEPSQRPSHRPTRSPRPSSSPSTSPSPSPSLSPSPTPTPTPTPTATATSAAAHPN